MHIETVRAGDNFIHVLIAGAGAAVVDPGMAAPIQALLAKRELALEMILLTHYHADHTGGCAALRNKACEVVGPPGGFVDLDRVVGDGEAIAFGTTTIEVLAVPGHTAFDAAYHVPGAKAVFTGDVLFAAGCGRMFSRDAQQMWKSLCRLRDLPDETRVYGGHDYTRENLAFAVHLEPDNAAVRERLAQFLANPATVSPSTLAEEKATNPFLRCDTDSVAAAANLSRRPAAEIFAAVRGMKDRW
jgi:hydroxyacylglutathione hydrolase